MESYVLLAKGQRVLVLVDVVQRVTGDPSIFAFGELLDVQSIKDLEHTEQASSLRLLRLFSTGTWRDYTDNSSSLPQLSAAQVTKLKQLTVVSIAESQKVVPYDHLMQQLGISNVRELEDLLITDCFYPRLIQGKLDQKARCLQIENAVGRDVQPQDLPAISAGLAHWLQQSQGLLKKLEERIERIHVAGEEAAARRRHEAEQVEEAKAKSRHFKPDIDLRSQEVIVLEDAASSLDFMDDDRGGPAGGRPKRRR